MDEQNNIQTRKQLDKLSKKVGQTLKTYQLIEPNDRILIGLSGGKDSYALLEILAERKKHIPFPFEIIAVHVHIKESGYINDLEYMRQFCNELHIPFHLIEENINLNQNPKKAACYVCSWHRRKSIFNLTKELNCNKLAFGHHMDDALETMMLNLIYHGSICSLPVKLSMFDERVELIRPLLFLDEKYLVDYAAMRQYPKELQKCPYDTATKRNEVGLLLEQMYKMNKNARKNLFRSMNNICTEYLPIPLTGRCALPHSIEDSQSE